MANPILCSVDKARPSVAPGASVEFIFTVQNLTALLDQVVLTLHGINPDWVEVIPRELPVFPNGQATARVIISPPKDPAQAIAGTYPIRISGRSQASLGQECEATTELQVQLVGDYVVSGASQARDKREASYSIHIQNQINAPLQLRLSASDEEAALWYKFDPRQPQVPPGGAAEVLLTVRARRPTAVERSIAFNLALQAESLLEGGDRVPAPPRQLPYRFVQLPRPGLAITLDPAAVHIADAGRARYELQLDNPDQEPLKVHLGATAEGSNLGFDFQPSELPLPPQSTTRAVLNVTPRSWPERGQQRTTPFSVTAAPIDAAADDDVQPVTTQGVLIQSRTDAAPIKPLPENGGTPWWILLIALGAAGLAVLCLIFTLFVLYAPR